MQTTFANQNSGSSTPTVQNVTPACGRSGGSAAAPQTNTSFAPANGNGNGNGRALIELLCKSKIYQDYDRAFSEATGLPVALRPVESWQLPFHGKRNENPFCCMLAQKSRSCAACLQVQEKLS